MRVVGGGAMKHVSTVTVTDVVVVSIYIMGTTTRRGRPVARLGLGGAIAASKGACRPGASFSFRIRGNRTTRG